MKETYETIGHSTFKVNLPPSIHHWRAGTNSGRRTYVRPHRIFVKRMNQGGAIIPSDSLLFFTLVGSCTLRCRSPRLSLQENGGDAVSQMGAVEEEMIPVGVRSYQRCTDIVSRQCPFLLNRQHPVNVMICEIGSATGSSQTLGFYL